MARPISAPSDFVAMLDPGAHRDVVVSERRLSQRFPEVGAARAKDPKERRKNAKKGRGGPKMPRKLGEREEGGLTATS